MSSSEQVCSPKMFLIWNIGCYSTTINQTVVLPTQNKSVGVGEGLGGLTTLLCKAGHYFAQALNLQMWVSQASTLPLQVSAHLPRSFIKMKKLPKHSSRLRSLQNSHISVSVPQDGCLRQLFALIWGNTTSTCGRDKKPFLTKLLIYLSFLHFSALTYSDISLH